MTARKCNAALVALFITSCAMETRTPISQPVLHDEGKADSLTLTCGASGLAPSSFESLPLGFAQPGGASREAAIADSAFVSSVQTSGSPLVNLPSVPGIGYLNELRGIVSLGAESVVVGVKRSTSTRTQTVILGWVRTDRGRYTGWSRVYTLGTFTGSTWAFRNNTSPLAITPTGGVALLRSSALPVYVYGADTHTNIIVDLYNSTGERTETRSLGFAPISPGARADKVVDTAERLAWRTTASGLEVIGRVDSRLYAGCPSSTPVDYGGTGVSPGASCTFLSTVSDSWRVPFNACVSTTTTCVPGFANSATPRTCRTPTFTPPVAARSYCSYGSLGYVGFYFPLLGNETYTCPSGTRRSVGGSNVFCLWDGVPREAVFDCTQISGGTISYSAP